MSIRFISLTACSILLLTPSFSSAVDVRVVGSNDEAEISIDVDGIRTIVGSRMEVDMFTRFKQIRRQPGLPPFSATMATVWIRCGALSASLAKVAILSPEGKPIDVQVYSVNWKKVDKETPIGRVWKYVCTREWETK